MAASIVEIPGSKPGLKLESWQKLREEKEQPYAGRVQAVHSLPIL